MERCSKWKYKKASIPVCIWVDFLKESILLGWNGAQMKKSAVMKAEGGWTEETFCEYSLSLNCKSCLAQWETWPIVKFFKYSKLSQLLIMKTKFIRQVAEVLLQKSHIRGFVRLKKLHSHASSDLTCGSFTVGWVCPMLRTPCPEGLVFLHIESHWSVAASSLYVNNSWFPLVSVQEQLICHSSCCQLRGTFSLEREIFYTFLLFFLLSKTL